MKNHIIKFIQGNMGTAELAEKKIPDVINGVWGRILQWVAMSYIPMLPSWRVTLHRMRGVKIGKKVFVGAGCNLDPVRPDIIHIEPFVSLNGNITIITHTILTEPLREILKEESKVYKPVRIKKGATIGMGVIILPGVTIGEFAIIGAGSVVSTDVPSRSIAVGNPARVVKKF